jgi:integrase
MIRQWIRPQLGSRKVAAVELDDIDALHRTISAKTPVRANRVRALLSKMFSLASTKWRSAYKIDHNPVQGSRRIREEGRRRYLGAEEMTRLMAAVDAHANQPAANAIRLLALTGARRAEVLSAQWTQFDLDGGDWTKPASGTKQNRRHHVPLSRDAVALLRGMRAEAEQATNVHNEGRHVSQPKRDVSAYLFPVQRRARNGAQHMTEIKSSWRAVCKAAELSDVHLHDLRHSFASALVNAGQSLEVIGAMLGHSQISTTQRYSRLYVDTLREAAEQIAQVVKLCDSSKT